MTNRYKAMESISLSTSYDTRWVIMDVESGEIVDDCGGYGYRTPESAYKRFNYLLHTGEMHNDY